MSKKITDFTELTAIADDDYLEIVDASEASLSLKNKKVSWLTIKTSLGVTSSSNFDEWDDGFEYQGGTTYYVYWENNIWQFISPDDETNVEPGTDDLVWVLASSGLFAHERNKDQYLDFGGANQVAVADVFLKTGARAMTGNATFGNNLGIDSATSGHTLNIAATNASTINIGRSGATVNILGTTNYIQVTNTQIADKLITINKGGAASSAGGTGIEIEENGTITGYIKTNSGRTGYEMLAPASADFLTFVLGGSGATIKANEESGNDYSLLLSADGTDGEVHLNSTSNRALKDGRLQSNALLVAGTSGNGYLTFSAQSSDPSVATDLYIFANSNDHLSWKLQDNDFTRTLAGTLTANRIYTLPDKAITFAGINNETFTGTTNFGATVTLLDTTQKTALDVSSSNVVRLGNGFTTLIFGSGSSNLSLVLNSSTTAFSSDGPVSWSITGSISTAFAINRNNSTSAATNFIGLNVFGTYAPTASGVGTYKGINLSNFTINQTGTSNQTITMIDVIPTLTRVQGTMYGIRLGLGAAPTGGGTTWNIFADGTALSHFNHSVLIGGTTSDSTATKTLTMHNGTAPGASVSNAFQLHASSGKAMIYEDADRYIVQAASSTKTTAGAPYANDGYVELTINGTTYKFMTTA